MHLPNPFGGYPLSLRPPDVQYPRRGELLYDYNTDDLMYVNRKTGIKKNVAQDIYEQLISIIMENSRIEIKKADEKVTGDDEIIPDPHDRDVNTWYVNITNRYPYEEPKSDNNSPEEIP